MENFLFQATIYLGAAVIAVPLAARLGLGSVLGYLLAGIVIGPLTGLVGTEAQDIQHFAEFGVVMMLFLIGLELEPRALWDMRDRLVGLGGLQVTLTTIGIMGAAMLLGYDWATALAIGLTIALSSTAIVLQTLAEKGLMQTGGGRSAFSVLLTQDIAVIPMLALLPLLAVPAMVAFAPDGSMQLAEAGHDDHATLSLVEGLPGWGVTLVTLGAGPPGRCTATNMLPNESSRAVPVRRRVISRAASSNSLTSLGMGRGCSTFSSRCCSSRILPSTSSGLSPKNSTIRMAAGSPSRKKRLRRCSSWFLVSSRI